jgi:hypothetical protein
VIGHACKGETPAFGARRASALSVNRPVGGAENAQAKVFCKPILAELSGTDCSTALGFAVQAVGPVLALCRRLIQVGYDLARPLEAWRGSILALRIRAIGDAAELEISHKGTGSPPCGRYSPAPSREIGRIRRRRVNAAAALICTISPTRKEAAMAGADDRAVSAINITSAKVCITGFRTRAGARASCGSASRC